MSLLKRTLSLLALIIAAAVFLHLGARGPSVAQVIDQGSPDDVWTKAPEHSFEIDTMKLKPTVFAAFNLNASKLSGILGNAPKEFTADARARTVILTLPLPNNHVGRFRIEESPIIEPKLAKRYPWLKSYSATGLDDRTATARFEVTTEGFTGMVMSASGTFFIDPASKRDPRLYISYFKKNLPRDPSGFVCEVNNPRPRSIRPRPKPDPKKKLHHALAAAAADSFLRIYRIAVAASSEYVSAIHKTSPSGLSGDPLTQALVAIHRTINRVNEIYERELGVRLELIGDEPDIIYPTAADDPYDPSADLNYLLDANQCNLDNVIGYNNYDVGHLFMTHGGGLSSEPCACDDWYKGNGVTGRPDPEGDPFDVDYVSHELGHQFGASHSFNGTTRGCKSRHAATAYEPGSGSTIMGYAGIGKNGTPICGDENVQNRSDDYFHAGSLLEINSFITNTSSQKGDTCSRKVQTTNLSSPVVVGPGDFVIPKGTPFTLTVQSGSDNDGDTVVYNWEEFDLGDPDPPKPGDPFEAGKIRPLFRSRKWGSQLSRTFPQLVDLLNKPPAGTYTAESLPMNNRTMVFRATVRDLRGRYGFADSQITVIATRRVLGLMTPVGPVVSSIPIGPFVVTQPSQAASWRRLSRHRVKWLVKNTNLAPVSCNNVRISLLIRGDEGNPIVLAAKVPNKGSAAVIVPANTPVGKARIKVEAVDNIFFNLAKVDVQIVKQ